MAPGVAYQSFAPTPCLHILRSSSALPVLLCAPWAQAPVRGSLTTTASTRTMPRQRSWPQRQLQRRLPRVLPLMAQLIQTACLRPRERQPVRVQRRTSQQLQMCPLRARIRQQRTGARTLSAALTHTTCCVGLPQPTIQQCTAHLWLITSFAMGLQVRCLYRP